MSDELRVERVDDLDHLRDEWDRLAEASGNLFATFEWASAWWGHAAGARESLLLGACRSPDGSTVGLVPLAVDRHRRLEIARLVGHGPADRLAPICAPGDREAVAEATHALLAESGADLFIGEQMPAEEGWSSLLGARVLELEASPVISIAGLDWEGFLAARSRNFRQQVRRHERRLAERGELRFRLSDPGRLQQDLETLFALHEARWSDGGSQAFSEPLRALHREFAPAAQSRGWLRLWVLELDGAPLAAWYGFRFGGAEWFYQSGRRPEADHVGSTLLAHTVRAAIEDGTTEYRLLRGDEPYKARFADHDPGLETIALPLTVRGRAYLAARAARSTAGRLRGRLAARAEG
jgi:CelD/BcsL family acetyltransferase involved in cellulose biosynthesis